MLRSSAAVIPPSHCRDQLFANVYRTVRFEVFSAVSVRILFIGVMAPHNLLDGTDVSGKHTVSFFCPTTWCMLQSRGFNIPPHYPIWHSCSIGFSLQSASYLDGQTSGSEPASRHHGRYVMRWLSKAQKVCKEAATLLRTSYYLCAYNNKICWT